MRVSFLEEPARRRRLMDLLEATRDEENRRSRRQRRPARLFRAPRLLRLRGRATFAVLRLRRLVRARGFRLVRLLHVRGVEAPRDEHKRAEYCPPHSPPPSARPCGNAPAFAAAPDGRRAKPDSRPATKALRKMPQTVGRSWGFGPLTVPSSGTTVVPASRPGTRSEKILSPPSAS